MVLTKAEAIALNLWNDIKDIKEIKEGSIESMTDTLEKLYPHSSFTEDVKLWTEFPPDTEFTLTLHQEKCLFYRRRYKKEARKYESRKNIKKDD